MKLLLDHSGQLFILFLFPLIGLFLPRTLPQKKVFIGIVICLVFLSPMLFGCQYSLVIAYPLIGLVLFSFLYSLLSKQIANKILRNSLGIGLTAILFVALTALFLLSKFGGETKVEESWEDNGYRVDNVVYYHKPMFGHPSTHSNYILIEYALFSILYKEIESVDEESIYACDIKFVEHKILFNKCHESIGKY